MSIPEATAQCDFTGSFRDSGIPLEIATLGALDRLQHALELEPIGVDRFRASNEAGRFGRLFGGQLVGQAMAAAAATVTELTPHSIHASFLHQGASSTPLDIAVDRTRDGRSMSIRQVTVAQEGRTLLAATVSFDNNPESTDLNSGAPPTIAPESMPLLQHWAQQVSGKLTRSANTWVDTPPPLEMRIAEAPIFLNGTQAPGPRTHWMRLPRTVDGGPGTHAVLMAYASDYLMLDMVFRAHPQRLDYFEHTTVTLDHSVWLHRPVQFDQWHLYTQRTVAIGGHRALVQGTIVDAAGDHVASTAQEVLVRPKRGPTVSAP